MCPQLLGKHDTRAPCSNPDYIFSVHAHNSSNYVKAYLSGVIKALSTAKSPYMSMHLIEPSHDLNNQTVSHIDVLVAGWSKQTTEDLRRADISSNHRSFVTFCLDRQKI